MTDLFRLAASALAANRLRSVLSMLGITIGITSVVLLTSIGEGTRRYMVGQFTQFGTNLMAINPGKSKTVGLPGALGGTTHPLTLDDAEALGRVSGVDAWVPVAWGTARVEAGNRGRSVVVYGVTPAVPRVWKWHLRQGSFWPEGDPRQAPPAAVLGPSLKRELFGDEPALGRFVRIGDSRFRVTGIMEPKGRMLGFDLDDTVFIPVARTMRLFNLAELTEIDLLYANAQIASEVKRAATEVLTRRHDDQEDFTITTQDAMLEVFGNVMDIVTLAVGAIGGISLLVGAVGILTMMWIAVGERTEEIGVLRSLGATRRQVLTVFLSEAALLSTLGGFAGLVLGLALCWVLRLLVPGLPVATPPEFVVAALATSLLTGIASGALPARRAASLDPIEALRAE
ncbi:MAG TPA: ABC transporter permease [Thermoanaerobaculia bacterium]|nr:ABC transporter permease [Thermoanaerobaculia bacterium]